MNYSDTSWCAILITASYPWVFYWLSSYFSFMWTYFYTSQSPKVFSQIRSAQEHFEREGKWQERCLCLPLILAYFSRRRKKNSTANPLNNHIQISICACNKNVHFDIWPLLQKMESPSQCATARLAAYLPLGNTQHRKQTHSTWWQLVSHRFLKAFEKIKTIKIRSQ